jgi:RNA polymerase sigma-70 factor, ECF subfamily
MSPIRRERYIPPSPVRSFPSPEALSAQFWDRIRVFAARRVKDLALAEDVAQETLRRVLDAIAADRVRNPDALPAFVFQTARHICMQRARSETREAAALERLHRSGDTPGVTDALRDLVTEEERTAVRRALAMLEARDQTLLHLLYFEQVEAAEAAHRLGVSPGALRVRKHRALARLASVLNTDQKRSANFGNT